MAKIIPLRAEEESLQDFLVNIVADLEERGCTNAIIAAKAPDNTVLIGYFGLDASERQEICAHVQCDIIDNMVRVNMGRYIEYWEGE